MAHTMMSVLFLAALSLRVSDVTGSFAAVSRRPKSPRPLRLDWGGRIFERMP